MRILYENASKKMSNDLQQVLDILEADDGKSFEEKKEEAIQLLRTTAEMSKTENKIEYPDNENKSADIKSSFWSAGNITSSADDIILRPVNYSDRSDYFEIQKSYSMFKSMLNDETYCDTLWKEYTTEKSLMCTIVKNGIYVGYCGINNITSQTYEIAIELKPEWTRKGIGSIAISAMLNRIKDCLDISKYKIRIDPTNYASQKLFEKLGAVPSNIVELLIHDEKALEQCEEENLHCIDEQLIDVARKFSVEPRKLLSHVLEYSLIWK